MPKARADYVFLTISPQSLYHSPVSVVARVYLLTSGTYRLSFPKELKIPGLEVKSETSLIHWRLIEDQINEVLEINADQPGEVVASILITGAVKDSGWDLYPLVSGHLQLSIRLDSYTNLRLRTIFPKGCRGYIHHSHMKINGVTYDFTPASNRVGRGLDHEVVGMRELEISYFLAENKKRPEPATIKVDAYFRQAFISLAGSFLLPFLVGFPIILVWGFPGLENVARLTFTLSAIPLVFSMWYRSLSSGIQDLLSLMDGIYVFLASVWATYAIFFQTWGTSSGLTALTPYFGLIFYAIFILFGFRAHPYKSESADPESKSIPKVLRIYRRISRGVAKILDALYYGKYHWIDEQRRLGISRSTGGQARSQNDCFCD